jgi:hypothetical protein
MRGTHVHVNMETHRHLHTDACTLTHVHTAGHLCSTWRSLSFCSWKASTVSFSCLVVWLVSTEALWALVSAWPQECKGEKVSWRKFWP